MIDKTSFSIFISHLYFYLAGLPFLGKCICPTMYLFVDNIIEQELNKFYKLKFKFKLNHKIFPKNLIFMSQELHFSISVVDPFVNVFVDLVKNVFTSNLVKYSSIYTKCFVEGKMANV
jgi:hypothetical protein